LKISILALEEVRHPWAYYLLKKENAQRKWCHIEGMVLL
jgi:hypothetical protein